MKRIHALMSAVVASIALTATPVLAADRDYGRPEWVQHMFIKEKMQAKTKAAAKKEEAMRPRKLTNIPREMKEALDKLTKKLPQLKGLHLRYAEMYEESGYHPELWAFALTDKEKGNRSQIEAEVVLVADTGELYALDYDTGKSIDGNITEKQAKEAADQFLKKVQEKKDEYKVTHVSFHSYDADDDDEQEDEDASFMRATVYYQREVNGIPVVDFGLSVEVDAEGVVTHYRNEAITIADKKVFPNPKRALNAEKAKQAYSKLVDMSLAYAYDWDNQRPILIYEPSFLEPIDAFTGKKSPQLAYEPQQEPKRFELSPEGNQWLIRSQQDAERMLERVFHLSMSDYELEYTEEEDGLMVYGWEATADSDKWGYIELIVDQETGKLLDYEFEGEMEEDGAKISEEEALQIATETLEQFLPADKREIQLAMTYSPSPEVEIPAWVDKDELDEDDESENVPYGFYFRDLYQGVPVTYSLYHVSVDAATGQVLEMGLYGEDDLTNLPDADDVISPSDAKKAYMEYSSLVLVYRWPTYQDQKAPKPVLVYEPENKPYAFVDAKTGEILSIEFEE
jgi:Zn-dependent metalloprotease